MESNVTVSLQRLSGVPLQVQFPSDEDWIARQRVRKVIVRNLGRGKSQTDSTQSDEFDHALLSRMAVGGAAPDDLEPEESAMLMRALERADVEDITRDGTAGFRISLRVAGGLLIEHQTRTPKAKELQQFRREFTRSTDLPHGRQEISINLQAGAEFYDAMATNRPDFCSIIHKVAVAAAVASELERMIEPIKTDF